MAGSKRDYPSGRDALILSIPKGTSAAKDVVRKALALMGWEKDAHGDWKHPDGRKGATPDATLSAALYTTLVKQEVVVKPDRGKIERGPKFNEALKAAKERAKAREDQ
jgi:hypothetical protein